MSYVYGKSGVTYTGRLVRDPERKTSGSGAYYTSLSVSVTTGPKQDGERYAPSIIVGTSVFGTAGDSCMRLEKGDVVTVSTMAIDSRDGQDGKKWYNAAADAVHFDAAVIERLCMRSAMAAAAAVDPAMEPAPLEDDDAGVPF